MTQKIEIVPSSALRGASEVAAKNLKVQREVLTINIHKCGETSMTLSNKLQRATEGSRDG